MATAADPGEEVPCLLQPPPSPSPQGVLRPTISSARRSSRSPGAYLGGTALNIRVPSLPNLHRRGTLVSTKLCDTRRKSYAGYVFDLSNSQEYYQFLEYNSLHDPHLKSYYYRKAMKDKLLKNGYVTPDLHVICHSLKEYNAYRNFLEFEFMKLRKQQEDEVKERERKHKSDVREQSRTSAMDKDREARRRTFYQQQEKKLRAKQLLLRRRERKEEVNKKKALEERKMQREKNEMKREAERERRKIQQLQREHAEMLRRKSLLRQNEMEDGMRRIHLVKLKQEERLSHLKEIERRWQIYEEHAEKAKEEEERRKREEKEEREKRMRRREKIFQMLQKREEERRLKVMEENHQHVAELKEEADKLEQEWQQKKICEMMEWKEKTQKKIQNWQVHLEHKKEAWRKENEKHVEELLSHPNAPQLHTAMSRTRKISGDSYKKISLPPHEEAAKKWLQKRTGPVRFEDTPTVHILEDLVLEEEADCDEDFREELQQDDECDDEIDAIEHRDSYHLQLNLQHKDGAFNMDASEQRSLTPAPDETVEREISNEDADREEDIVSRENEMREQENVSETQLLVAERSTASDVVSLAMTRALDRAATPVEDSTLEDNN